MAFRPFGSGARRPGLNQPLLQAMWQANQLLANGHADQAAELLVQLAQQMDNRGFPRRAANVHAQAARAWAQAKNEAGALNQSRVALDRFLQLGMGRRAATFYQNERRSLQDNGLKGAADILEKEFDAKVKALGVQTGAPRAGRGRLPGKCPQCGAPVRTDEVDWIDDASAECAYCGTVIQAE